MANTRGQGLIPAKKRATGKKGSKAKEKMSVREMVQMLKAEQQFRNAVKNAKIDIRIRKLEKLSPGNPAVARVRKTLLGGR